MKENGEKNGSFLLGYGIRVLQLQSAPNIAPFTISPPGKTQFLLARIHLGLCSFRS